MQSPASSANRVLLVIHRMHFGGAELQLGHLAKALVADGHDVTLCCIDNAVTDVAHLRAAGVRVVQLGASSRLARLAAVPRIARLARRADVVQCTMWDASLWGRLAAILARRPVVIADHAADRSAQIAANGAGRGSWIALHNRLLDRFTYATVACADSQLDVLRSEGVASEKIVHIPNGVPIAELRAAATGGPTRRELGIPDDAKVAVQVGVFRAEKNQAGALEAFQAVREQVQDVHLVFVGDGALREEVETRAREIGAEWAHFIGFREDVPAILSLADIMVQPSLHDAMPMTVIEALALGVPVVGTDVGDVAATLASGGGITVPPGDVEAFAAACVQLLSHLDSASSDDAERVAQAFGSDTMAHRYAALFDAAVADRSPRSALAMAG
jgi:glycosyltransferase involved in cell wall biosynthesis